MGVFVIHCNCCCVPVSVCLFLILKEDKKIITLLKMQMGSIYVLFLPCVYLHVFVCVCDAVIHAGLFMIEMEQWHQSSSHLPSDRTPEWER